jgi:phosphoribosylanthranilate isomerase
MKRTRIKICGLTRAEDVRAAAEAGADAVGFVCYPASPRFVPAERLAPLARQLPPFVTPVLLFVNAPAAAVDVALAQIPGALLQFHGAESRADCERFGRSYLRAVRMEERIDLIDCERRFTSAGALLVDAPAPGFGGGGQVFNWTWLPPAVMRGKPLVLAGGLSEANVADAIRQVRPFAVDVSSGVETAPGIKSAEQIHRFVAAVRAADADNRDA